MSSFWNSLEFAKVVMSIVAISMYLMKNAYVTLSLGDIANREGMYNKLEIIKLFFAAFLF